MTKNIVFVIGAGANSVYNFPTGLELIPLIRSYLNKRLDTLNSPDIALEGSLKDAVRKLDCTTIPSIDLFMQIQSSRSQNPDDPVTLFCRRGIVKTILDRESSYISEPNKKPDWLEYLINEIAIESNHTADSFKNSRIKFITFNYDRLIEYKIRETFDKLLGISDISESNRIVEEFANKSIVHVYGQVGTISNVDFGKQLSNEGINSVSKGINLIGDRRTEEDARRISKILEETDQLHFLGFGFNEENIDQLGLEHSPDIRLVSGTCRGILLSERNKISYKFWKQLKKRLVLNQNNNSCMDYIKNAAEFKYTLGIAHFKSTKTGEIQCKSIHEECTRFVPGRNILATISELTIGEMVVFGNNSGEAFTYLGKLDPTLSQAIPAD